MTPLHIFAGYPTEGPATVVHLLVEATGYECDPLTHYIRHSPDGFAWGYAGSGPTELARCLLIASLAASAWCRTCGGHGNRDRASQACVACDSGFDRPRVEDRYFKVRDRLIARLPASEGLAVTGADILTAADLGTVFPDRTES